MLHRELVVLPNLFFTVGVSSDTWSGVGKRPRLLTPNKIAELIVDTDSDKVRVSSDVSSVQGGSESVPGVSQPQLYRQTASCYESNSSVLSSASDKEDARESGPGEQTQQAVTLQQTHPSCPQSSVLHTYTGGLREKEDNDTSHINDNSSPLSIFPLYFLEIITLLTVETNHYYHDYVDRLHERRFPEPDVPEAEMFVFLAVTIRVQMCHGVRDELTDYCATLDRLYTPFCGTIMKWDKYLHILR